MKHLKLFLSLLLFSVLSCKSDKKTVEFSFFTAGHIYGNPRDEAHPKGLYKPFTQKFKKLNEDKNMKFGVLLGDIVWKSEFWKEAELDISKLKMPVHYVRGNHDGKLDFFQGKFGKTYKKFMYQNNLFIILDTNIDKWNILGDQLIFLMNTLRNDGKKADNIFILTHHLLWYSKENFPNPIPNSTYGRALETNFWSKIEPLLRNQKKPVFLFAGDMGAFPKEFRKQKNTIEYFYYNYDNITFIGTGMGGGVKDNFVIVDILKNKTVDFRLIHLNGDNENSLGRLDNYELTD